MKYQEIRDAFKECAITVSSNGISLVFPQYPVPQYINVPVDDDEMGNRHVFEELLDKCTKFRVVLQPGLDVKLDFTMEIPVENDLVFPALRKEISAEDIEKIISSNGLSPRKDFLEAFEDVNVFDDGEVLERVSELIQQDKRGEVLPMRSIRDWPEIKASASEFYNNCHFGSLALEDPDKYVTSGAAVFNFESEAPYLYELDGQCLDSFRELVKTSNWYSLDGFSSNESACAVLSFYS
jgi:hypothetical protein